MVLSGDDASFEGGQAFTSKREMTMKTLMLLLILSLPAAAQQRVIREYDRFEDRTRYWTTPQSFKEGLDLTAYLSFQGKGAGREVDEMSLIFISTSSDWQYLKNTRLYCIVDGKRFDFGPARAQNNDVKAGYRSVEVREVLMFPISFQTLQKISQANSVDMRLGKTEFHLDQYFRESLKELLTKVRAVRRL